MDASTISDLIATTLGEADSLFGSASDINALYEIWRSHYCLDFHLYDDRVQQGLYRLWFAHSERIIRDEFSKRNPGNIVKPIIGGENKNPS